MIEASHTKDVRTPKKVLLANGHRLFRRGLREMLSSAGEDIEVLGEAQDDQEIVKLAGEMEPDVVMLDAEEPPAQERTTIERLLEASLASGLVVIALQDDSPHSIRHLLLLASRGLSSRQIAHHLRLSEAPVKRHLTNLYHKMGVSSRGEATRKALGKDWICVRDVTQNGQDLISL